MRPLRRLVLVAASVALAAPVLAGAQPEESDRVSVDIIPYGGRTRYTSCSNTHDVAYGGLSGDVRYRFGDGADLRISGGVGGVHEDGDSGASGGLVLQAGEDWAWFGLMAGIGVWGASPVDAEEDEGFTATPVIPLTVRIGPRDGLQLRAGLMDQVPLDRGLLWGELAWANPEVGELALGIRFHPYAGGTPSYTLGGQLRVGSRFRVGGRIGVGDMNGRWLPQGELLLGIDVETR